MRTKVAKVTLVVVVATATALLAGIGDRPATTPDPQKNFQAYRASVLRQHFPNVPLVTQDKKTVHFYDDVIKGRTVVLQFMFANCEQYCPMVTPNLVKVQRELQKRAAGQVTMASITVDPVHDTPDALKEYASKFHVQPGWNFLTGRKSDIDRIRRELGVWDPDEQKIEHMNVLTIGREKTGDWIAIEGLAKPDDIVQTVLRFTPRPRVAAGVVPPSTVGAAGK
jgi:protein SCO1/2